MAAENDIQAAQPTAEADEPQVRFGVQRLYIKDASFEAPDTPESFRRAYAPQINFSINSRSKPIEDGIHEVVLRLTADVKQDNKTVFLVEVQQAGIFEVAGLDGERLEQVLSITCPSVLFPYGREAVDALVTKGSFPALMLAPINFEAVYAQAKRNQAERAEVN
ncbi:MAG: protein-export chaperone SecB [Pseudomonadales bacterium]|jgi:preprotein translocase subunit SecB|nr:protein-export chaperone SecB [Pseudomonadales bacterium]